MKTCLCFILLLLAALSLASCKESEKDTALRFPAPRSLTAVWKPLSLLPVLTVQNLKRYYITIKTILKSRKQPASCLFT